MTNAPTKKLLIVLTSFALLMSTGKAYASAPTSNDEPLTVKYLGADDGYLLFEVTFQAGNAKKPFFQIEDEMAGEIYSRTVTATSSTIKFKIEKVDDQALSFSLTTGKNTYSKSFSETDIRKGNDEIAATQLPVRW